MNSVEKYIDFDQFPKTKAGRISWKNCVGLTFDFVYIGKIRYCIKTGKCFNDYILNYTTYEEYYDFVYSRQVS